MARADSLANAHPESAHAHAENTVSKKAYVFDATGHDSELQRLRLIESVFDSGSREMLIRGGLSRGMNCLEVGAGAGSIAAFMAKTVGRQGRVAAVDLSTRFLRDITASNIDVYEADILDVDLPAETFDVAHARFVFIHVPEWRAALNRVVQLLKPGGLLVLEEPDFSASRALSGTEPLRASFERVHQAIFAMFEGRQLDHAFGLRLPAIFQGLSLGDMALVNDAPIVQGGSPFATMMGMSASQLRQKYKATGLATDEDIENYRAFTAAPSSWAIYHGTVRAAARNRRMWM
ncbi:MAG: class I SAM-dependent methyltransferase [Polyangiaceae bacterium]|nr:class I SAM-dependent methyltransferase [Polyangiaceae bacterium]